MSEARFKEDALKPYEDWQAKHGTDFGVTLWASRASQELRFKIFSEMVDLNGKRILDLGCSRGDFAAYLLAGGVEFSHYTGVDGLKDVIGFAGGRGLVRTDFRYFDLLAEGSRLVDACGGGVDVVVISGTLNTMSDDEVFRVLDAAWEVTGEVLIFNFLSDRSGRKATPQDYPARRLDSFGLMGWGFSRTPLLRYAQDYFTHGHDATIYMRKEGCGGG